MCNGKILFYFTKKWRIHTNDHSHGTSSPSNTIIILTFKHNVINNNCHCSSSIIHHGGLQGSDLSHQGYLLPMWQMGVPLQAFRSCHSNCPLRAITRRCNFIESKINLPNCVTDRGMPVPCTCLHFLHDHKDRERLVRHCANAILQNYATLQSTIAKYAYRNLRSK